MEFASVTVCLREKLYKERKVRKSPSEKFVEIGSLISSGSALKIENAAEEYAVSAYQDLTEGSGKTFSYGVIETPAIPPVRIDGLLQRRVRDLLAVASSAAELAPPKYFKGVALETFDGTMKLVDLRGLFPEAKLILSAGGKEISCVVPVSEVEMLRNSLGRRVLATGRAQHDGKGILPDRIDVTKIIIVEGSSRILSIKGVFPKLSSASSGTFH